MSSTNADSMTNAQGEFQPSVPRSEPLTTKGHQVGQMVGNDAVPVFHAQVLPAGSAPAKDTYKPNPINEVPGQANNPDTQTTTAALSMPGATSGDVHTGLGHPGSGQSSSERHNEGKNKRQENTSGSSDSGATGGSGMQGDDDMSAEARRLQEDRVNHGPKASQEHNTSLTGAEGKAGQSAEQVASELN